TVVQPDPLAQDVAELADRATGPQRLAQQREQILGPARSLSHPLDRRLRGLRVALSAYARRSLQVAALGLRIEPVQLDRLRLVLLVLVHPDDHALACLDLLRVRERRLLDLALDEPLLDGRDRAAQLVDTLDQLPRA